MTECALTFDCGDDSLVGILHEPQGRLGRIGVLIVVGGPQYRVGSHRQFVLMARHLAAAGYPVLRFDFRGMGDSAGLAPGFDAVNQDIAAAVDALLARCPWLTDVALIGLCDGASAAAMYTPSDPRIAGLVLINPWVRNEATQAQTQVTHYYGQRVFQRAFWAKLLSGKVNVVAAMAGFINSWSKARPKNSAEMETKQVGYLERMRHAIATFQKPILLVMSGRDLTAREFDVLCQLDARWARALDGAGVSRVDITDADHTFSSSVALGELSGHCISWLAELPASDAAVPR